MEYWELLVISVAVIKFYTPASKICEEKKKGKNDGNTLLKKKGE